VDEVGQQLLQEVLTAGFYTRETFANWDNRVPAGLAKLNERL